MIDHVSPIDRADALLGRSPTVADPRFAPHWGWHDDHRDADGTPDYRPAVMQVRAETASLLDELAVELPRYDVVDPYHLGQRALQLGIGFDHGASHALWRLFFDDVLSLDLHGSRFNDDRLPPLNTRDPAALAIAERHAPYDLLFIDAGHACGDVRHDHGRYQHLVRRGGFVVFHDALPRPIFPELGVWRYLTTLSNLTVVGDEVGTAWLRV